MLTRVVRSLLNQNSFARLQVTQPRYFQRSAVHLKETQNHIDKPTKIETQPRTRLSLRRQKLPPYPPIEVINSLDIKRFAPTNFKYVKYGDYEFKECLEGYVCIYASGYQFPRPPNAPAGYAVYYGKNHPLNIEGSVERRQGLNHSKLYAFCQMLKSIPKNLFDKVCLGMDDMTLLNFVAYHLRLMSENAFRSTYTGKLNKDLETNMEINTLLRTRQDLTFRLQYVPNDVGFPDAYQANKNAIRAADQAERQQRIKFRPED